MKKAEKLPLRNIKKLGVYQAKKRSAGTPSTDPTTSNVVTSTHFGY
jgi:hypothetical protein